MSFVEFASAPNVWPFSIALLLFFLITGLEIVLGLIGFGSDFGLDTDRDIDVDLPESSWLTRAFDWLGLGKVPYLVTLSGFLLLFGISGMFVQYYRIDQAGAPWSWVWVALACVAISIPIMRVINHLVGKVWPKEIETSVRSQDALIGQAAEITMGDIANDRSGQIKVRDAEGTTHYVLAVADLDSDQFAPGDPLLVVGRRGRTYTVRRNPLPALPTD